jgi:anti-anti-sigma regulatory factor
MIEFETDDAKNLFVIRYCGHVTAEETGAQVDPMKLALEKMRPGFGLLADLTDLQSMDADCAPHIRQIMDYSNAHGVAAVVRVIPDPTRDIGMQIMSRFHYSGNVQIATAATSEEAHKLLFD